MAGTIVAGTLSDGTYSGSVTDTVRGACKAWVNFNGTGTVAIRAAYNVSSITDNGTGDYTLNFTTAMSDANYAAVANMGGLSTGVYGHGVDVPFGAITSSTVTMQLRNSINNAVDSAFLSVAIFR